MMVTSYYVIKYFDGGVYRRVPSVLASSLQQISKLQERGVKNSGEQHMQGLSLAMAACLISELVVDLAKNHLPNLLMTRSTAEV
jgi:hypothetical protein